MHLLRRVAIASACVFISGSLAAPAFAQAPVDPSLVVLRAKSLRDVIHDWHHDGHWPPNEEYCKKYKDAEGILGQLQSMLLNGPTGGLSPQTVSDAYKDLNSELAEEDDINDEEFGRGYNPCNPPPEIIPIRGDSVAGFYVGTEFMANWGKLGITETDRFSGATTNQFDRSGKRDGFGFQFGWKGNPWNNPWTVSPFAAFDFYDQTIRQTFPNTSYLGTATNWSIQTGVKIGYDLRPDLNVYGLGAATFLNQKTEINFGGVSSSETKTVPGLTLGAGFEYRPMFLQGFGVPLTMYAQYQHTEYQAVHLDAPAASPSFNYKFQLRDDVIKLGVNAYLWNRRF